MAGVWNFGVINVWFFKLFHFFWGNSNHWNTKHEGLHAKNCRLGVNQWGFNPQESCGFKTQNIEIWPPRLLTAPYCTLQLVVSCFLSWTRACGMWISLSPRLWALLEWLIQRCLGGWPFWGRQLLGAVAFVPFKADKTHHHWLSHLQPKMPSHWTSSPFQQTIHTWSSNIF